MEEESESLLGDSHALETLAAKLRQIARFRYRIRPADADDVVQTTFATYLEVRHRYEAVADQRAILVGIFRKKCLEYIDRSVREQRRLQRYCTTADAARENAWIKPSSPGHAPSVLDDLTRAEERREILEVIDNLRPSSRTLVDMIVNRNMGRTDLIAHLGLNKNTLDSRLRSCRIELSGMLRKRALT
jgi:RNA polymerase sigma factor (sigma-70 family)